MAELKLLSAGDIAARLARLQAAPDPTAAPTVDAGRTTLRDATALVGWFTTEAVEELEAGRPDVLRDFLVEDCERVTTAQGNRWRLRPIVRREAVRRLATARRLARALRLTDPDPTDLGRAQAESYVRGRAQPLAQQSAQQLRATLQAVEWLDGSEVDTPSREEVEGRLAVTDLLQPLRRLVGPSFVGRQAELQRLEEYVGGADERPPLVIHGPGGIGKSTLVGRFVLDRVDDPGADRLPFAYLSFDRMDLRTDRPLTLLAEAVRQLGAQYPAIAGEADDFGAGVRDTLRSMAAAQREAGPAKGTSSGAARSRPGDHLSLIERFCALVELANDGRRPSMLWILDTFEQAQRRGWLAMAPLWEFLGQFRSLYPGLRVVVAGRAPLDDDQPADELALTGLDDEVAVLLLRKELEGTPGLTTRFLESVVRQLSNNPLSLKLGAELIRTEGAKGLRRVATQRRILLMLSDEEVQGLLYRRILDHLDDPDLRKIANPGLVVRFVTAEIIGEVLAVPCELGEIDEDRAAELFDGLRRESSLFERDPDNAEVVRHRNDVRKVMLPLLARAYPDKVNAIHRRAMSYYAKREGPRARAEELYHRLSLDQATSTVDRRWDDEAGVLLEDALDELPPKGRAYLAGKLGRPVDQEALAQADDDAWARKAAQTGRALLDARKPADALELVRQRTSLRVRPVTAPLEVEALAYLGRTDEALRVVESSMDWAAAEGRTPTFIELAVLGARIAEDAGRFKDAEKGLEQVRVAADASGDRIVHLAAGVALLRVYRRSDRSGRAAARRLRAEVVRAAGALTRRQRTDHPSLVRDLAAEIGDDAPDLVAEAARLVGVDVEGDVGRVLDGLLSGEEAVDFAAFQGAEDAIEYDAAAEGSFQTTFGGRTAAEQGRSVSDYLQKGRLAEGWSRKLSQAYQREADSAAFTL